QFAKFLEDGNVEADGAVAKDFQVARADPRNVGGLGVGQVGGRSLVDDLTEGGVALVEVADARQALGDGSLRTDLAGLLAKPIDLFLNLRQTAPGFDGRGADPELPGDFRGTLSLGGQLRQPEHLLPLALLREGLVKQRCWQETIRRHGKGPKTVVS